MGSNPNSTSAVAEDSKRSNIFPNTGPRSRISMISTKSKKFAAASYDVQASSSKSSTLPSAAVGLRLTHEHGPWITFFCCGAEPMNILHK